ncbi:MAG: Wzz/FepE/Etk N-terminal domain-containing protein [candidate division KSB1 bacterium]|nr:Wzz/FepE/Etk N-terminal domain-containing protein [candidate division KSB1 bacterium]
MDGNSYSNNHQSNGSYEDILNLLNQKPTIDFRLYWFRLWRKKWWIVLSTFVCTSLAVVYALLIIKPIYESSTTFEISPSRLYNSVRSVTPGTSQNVDYQDVQRKILSTEYLALLGKRVGMDQDPEIVKLTKEILAQRPWLKYDDVLDRSMAVFLRRQIKIKMIGPRVFQIVAESPSPNLAYSMAKTLTDIFIDESKKDELRGIRGIKEFSDEQLAIYKKKVELAEDRLKQLQEKIARERIQTVGLNEENIVALKSLIFNDETAIINKQNRLAELQKILPEGLKRERYWDIKRDFALIKRKLNEKLDDFKKRISISMQDWKSSYEFTFNSEINRLRQQSFQIINRLIAESHPNLGDLAEPFSEYQRVLMDLSILNKKIEIARRILNRYYSLATSDPAQRMELERLEEEIEKNREVYNLFLSHSRGSQIEEALQNSDMEFKYKLIEKARMPIYATKGSKRVFVMIVFLVSGLGSVAVVLAWSFFDQTIRDVKGVENELKLPVLGVIPKTRVPFAEFYQNYQPRAYQYD